MYQQITLIGYLGSDPELRHTQDGTPVCNFRLAVHKSWTTTSGEKAEKTTWFRVTTWRKQAETVSQYLRKGKLVMVTGEVEEPNAFLNREGQPSAVIEVTAQLVKFLSGEAPGADIAGGQSGSELDIPF
jgi:single-strand DNA-binding protein